MHIRNKFLLSLTLKHKSDTIIYAYKTFFDNIFGYKKAPRLNLDAQPVEKGYTISQNTQNQFEIIPLKTYLLFLFVQEK